MSERMRLAVSACLAGQRVRHDGGHRRDDAVARLARTMELVPLCPEVAVGMGVPRETVRLRRRGPDVQLVAPRSQRDWTGPMRAWARAQAAEMAAWGLSGAVLKGGSPSCGVARVKVYDDHGAPAKTGQGLFAEALRARLPLLPVEEDGRLRNAEIYDNFVQRVHAYHALGRLFDGAWRVSALVAFHTRMKLVVLAREPAAYVTLGRLVAAAAGLPREAVAARYAELLMGALATLPTRGRHANVLHHVAGYFKRVLPPEERRELEDLVEEYRRGLQPIEAPLALVRHHVRKHHVAYLAEQAYLLPRAA